MMPEIKFESQEKKYVANFKLYFLLTLGIKVYDLSENAAKQIWLDVTRRGETYSKMYSKKFVMLYNITTFVKPILIQTYMIRNNGYFDPLTWKKRKKKIWIIWRKIVSETSFTSSQFQRIWCTYIELVNILYDHIKWSRHFW